MKQFRTLTRILIFCNVLLFLMTAQTCARAVVFNYKHIDAPLKPYTDVYFSYLKTYCDTNNYNKSTFYTIELVNEMDDAGWIGVCETKVNGFSIKISKEWWKANPNKDIRQQLINHEMAHCLIYKEHVNDKTNYMNPALYYVDPQQVILQTTADIYNYCHL